MANWKRWVGMVVMTALLMLVVQLLAHFPSGSPPTEGMVRMAWRMAGEKVKLCRAFTKEEQEKMLIHMRKPQFCREHLLSYRLRVTINGEEKLAGVYQPPGAKGDRPLFIQEELTLSPGTYQLDLVFMPEIESVDWKQEFGELTAEEKVELQDSLDGVARVQYQGTLEIKAGRIILVDMDERDRTIVIKDS